ncbi:MAG: NUDIX domain-containing protein, partial [Alphaproteobacteria bacterium]
LRGSRAATRTPHLPPTGPLQKRARTSAAGRLEAGDSAAAAARRELSEETGLTPLSFWNGDTLETFYELATPRLQIAPVFVARVHDDAVVRLNYEHDDHRWLDLEQALATVSFNQQRRVLTEVWDSFVRRTPADYLKLDP